MTNFKLTGPAVPTFSEQKGRRLQKQNDFLQVNFRTDRDHFGMKDQQLKSNTHRRQLFKMISTQPLDQSLEERTLVTIARQLSVGKRTNFGQPSLQSMEQRT